ncbi:RNA polymerase, sigma-24 subunit, ECF subfamily [Verrucomicrobia bacterium]|nr:RNA polymerase, sigma-24 subunit, ECF subfamily [Verrucomicrobiota bacterium]
MLWGGPNRRRQLRRAEQSIWVHRKDSYIIWHNAGESDNSRSLSDVTRILESIEHGDPKAADELLPLVYEELRKLAASKMARETPNQTLQPTALVHEAWLRLVGEENPQFANRAHFFSAAAEAMRRILIENARRKRALRHGGGQQRVDREGVLEVAAPVDDEELLAVSDALDKLASIHALQAEVVKLRYFVGMTNVEAAQGLGLSERTVKNYWAHARAWLFREMQSQRR